MCGWSDLAFNLGEEAPGVQVTIPNTSRLYDVQHTVAERNRSKIKGFRLTCCVPERRRVCGNRQTALSDTQTIEGSHASDSQFSR
jgi:hypothetical protein